MNEYMKIAKELSDDNLKTNVVGPFGACIVKDEKNYRKRIKSCFK